MIAWSASNLTKQEYRSPDDSSLPICNQFIVGLGINYEVWKERTLARIYIDDIMVFSKNLNENIPDFKTILYRIENYSLKIKLSKSVFVRDSIII